MKTFITLFFILVTFFGLAQGDTKEINILKNKILKLEQTKKFRKEVYTNYLNELGILYYKQEKYSEAEPLYIKALEIRKEISGENTMEYASSLNQLGALYFQQERYMETEPLYIKSLGITKEILGENHPDYILYLNNLAHLYEAQGKTSAAEQIFLKTLEIRKKYLGEKHIDYAKSLNNLAGLYYDLKQYNQAEIFCLKSLEIKKVTLGEKNPDYAKNVGLLASIYFAQKKYLDAEKFYLISLKIKEDIFDKYDNRIIVSLINLTSLYRELGNYLKAEEYYLKISTIEKNNLGEKNPKYITTLNNLAVICFYQGKYFDAEQYYKKTIDLRKEVLGEKNIDYASSLNNLAELYRTQNKFEKAEPLYKNAIVICKELKKENDPIYIISLSNLALLYTENGNFSEAESILIKVLEINRNTLGEESPKYATSLYNIGGLYAFQNKYLEAEKYLSKSIEIRKKILGEKHPVYAFSVKNLAQLYQNQGKYLEANSLFLKSYKIEKEVLSNNHPDYISSIFSLAQNYRDLNLIDKSSSYYADYITSKQERIKEDFNGNTENEITNLLKINRYEVEQPLSFLKDFSSKYPEIIKMSFDSDLLIKNISLRNKEQIKKAIQKSNNIGLQDKYERFITSKKQLTKLSETHNDKRDSNYTILKDETEELEKDLSRESTTFSDFKKSISITFNEVKSKLKKDEVIIDIVNYNYYNKKETDSVVYSAFVVGKDFKYPKFISLFEEKQLKFLLERNKNEHDSTRINKQYLDKAISDLFLKPLEKELKDVSAIYLSPSGLAHQLAFSALPISENQTFGEKYNLHILSSPAEIMDYKVAGLDKKSNLELLLYGGIDYNKTNSLRKSGTDIVANNEILNELQTRSGISEFGYLPGSKKEVTAIQLKATKNGFRTTLLDDRVATEESVKQLDGRTSPFILHLATHGFFFPDPKQELSKDFSLEEVTSKIYKVSEEPMMRSGLLFAGANKYWGKPNENLTEENGILTASEISNLDLSACQLVVLSACETGLGQVKGSEGVFGLQRAFKMAGVKNIIMSLWKVPDAQTAELFEIFYGECFAGKSIHEAFQTAQTKMKVNYSPYYWGGFVLLE